MGIGINIAGTGIGLTQTIMNQKNKQAGRYDEVSGRVTHCTLHWFDDTQGNEAVMSTSLAGGGSLTVYKPADFNPKDPKYLVKAWDGWAKWNFENRVAECVFDALIFQKFKIHQITPFPFYFLQLVFLDIQNYVLLVLY